MDNVPVVVVTGQVPTSWHRRLPESDVVMQPVTKHNYLSPT